MEQSDIPEMLTILIMLMSACCLVSVLGIAQLRCRYLVMTVNDVIGDKNIVTKIMSEYTGLQHIGFNGFVIRHWQTDYYPVAGGLCLCLC